MSTIIAGRFEEQAEIEAAVSALRSAGFPANQISSFFLSPAGQHARFSIGGDRDVSPGAEDSAKGTAAGTTGGGLVGAAIGAVTTPLTGPLGAVTGGLVGAHIGNLVGALGKMKDDDSPDDAPLIRHAGLMVAVSAPVDSSQQRAIEVFRQCGARVIEQGDGHIVDGDWQDFDPAARPQVLDAHPAPSSRGGHAGHRGV